MNERLMEWATAETGKSRDVIETEVSRQELSGPGWGEFLPKGLRAAWPDLSHDARIVAFAFGWRALSDFEPDASTS